MSSSPCVCRPRFRRLAPGDHRVEPPEPVTVADAVAERRYGELLKDLARATPAEAGAKGNAAMGRISPSGTCDASPYAEVLARDKISRQAAHSYQALAEVPQAVFDEALALLRRVLRAGREGAPSLAIRPV